MGKPKTNKYGFTLVELVVAMFLMSMVSLIGGAVAAIVSRSQATLQLDAKSEAELVELNDSVKNWLMKYDSDEYALIVTTDSVVCSGEEMRFENGSLYCGEEIYEFGTVEKIEFGYSGKLILCAVTLKETDYVHKILYAMRVVTPSSEAE